MEINQRIRDLINSNNTTQKTLSEAISVSTSTLNNWLKLNRSIPSEFIIPICEFFGVTSDFLLTGKHNTDSKKIIDISPEEQKIISDYRELSEQGQEYIEQQLFMAKEVYKKEQDIHQQTEEVG